MPYFRIASRSMPKPKAQRVYLSLSIFGDGYDDSTLMSAGFTRYSFQTAIWSVCPKTRTDNFSLSVAHFKTVPGQCRL